MAEETSRFKAISLERPTLGRRYASPLIKVAGDRLRIYICTAQAIRLFLARLGPAGLFSPGSQGREASPMRLTMTIAVTVAATLAAGLSPLSPAEASMEVQMAENSVPAFASQKDAEAFLAEALPAATAANPKYHTPEQTMTGGG